MATLEDYDDVKLTEVALQELHFAGGDLAAVLGLRIGTGTAAVRVNALHSDPEIAAKLTELTEVIERKYIELTLGTTKLPEPPQDVQL